MDNRLPHDEHDHGTPSSRSKWVLIGFLAVAAFFLWTEHRAHVLGLLPYLLFLACPLMHLFHHHGHRHRHGMHQADEFENRPITDRREHP